MTKPVAAAPFTGGRIELVVDSNEQRPYLFEKYPDVLVVRAKLATADYSIVGLESRFAIERKSTEDAYSTFSRGRGRFCRELERMDSMDFAAIVVEGDLRTLKYPPPSVEKVQPETVIKSLLAWTIDHNVRVFFASDRPGGELVVHALARAYLDRASSRTMVTW